MHKIISFLLLLSTALGNPVTKASRVPVLINGTEAKPGQFPYLAHISYFNSTAQSTYVDSAVLISERHLLAKAEFLVNWSDVTVVLGALFPRQNEPEQQKFVVKFGDIIFQDEIRRGTDLAIIPLPTSIVVNDRVKPVLLPRLSDKGLSYLGWDATVSAWINGPQIPRAAVRDVKIFS